MRTYASKVPKVGLLLMLTMVTSKLSLDGNPGVASYYPDDGYIKVNLVKMSVPLHILGTCRI